MWKRGRQGGSARPPFPGCQGGAGGVPVEVPPGSVAGHPPPPASPADRAALSLLWPERSPQARLPGARGRKDGVPGAPLPDGTGAPKLTAGAERHLFGKGVSPGDQPHGVLRERGGITEPSRGGGARGAPRPRKVPSSILTASHAVATGPAPLPSSDPRPPPQPTATTATTAPGRQAEPSGDGEGPRGPQPRPSRLRADSQPGGAGARGPPVRTARPPRPSTRVPLNSRQGRDPPFSDLSPAPTDRAPGPDAPDTEAQGEHLRGPAWAARGTAQGGQGNAESGPRAFLPVLTSAPAG
ncbi:proline-rich protein 2-like [Eschrichtius robustus]|uniref:proline-rich protein 2-like n=1 Tax=Eschrichtius robustus TaxID=9764 RepID=UPI0035C072FA